MAYFDIVNKTVEKHANGKFKIKLLVGDRSVANLILSSVYSSKRNKDIGELLELKKTHHNTNLGEIGYTLKCAEEDIILAIDTIEGFNSGYLELLLSPVKYVRINNLYFCSRETKLLLDNN